MFETLTHPVALFLSDRLNRLASSDSMRAIREGLLWIVPSLLVSACFLVLAVILKALQGSPALVNLFMSLHEEISRILPLLVAASIGYMLSIRHRLPRLPVAFLSFAYVAIASTLMRDHPRAAATFILFIAIASPLVNVPIMAWLHRQSWAQIARAELIGNNVRDALSLVIPGVLTACLLVFLLRMLLLSPLVELMDAPIMLPTVEQPYLSGLFLSALNSLLWFFGVHGYHALQPLFQMLDHAVVLNAQDLQAGNPQHLLNSSLLGAFVFIGGSGGTFSLLFAILFSCHHRSLRLLAWASLPIAFLNVNEILLFGLPIILNPRLILPFFVVPMLNLALALGVTQVGLVAPATISLPLTSPVLLNAYLATGGDFAAIALQLALVGIGALIYAPFIRSIDREGQSASTIYVRSLDTTFTQLHEEASLYADDPVISANKARKSKREQNERIRQISEYEFYLEYQPQVSLRTGLCTGCEALLRARDQEGRTQQPWEFLNWLEKVGLMKDLDIWVASTALQQVNTWRALEISLPMTINVTGYTLDDPVFRDKLVKVIAQAEGTISIEITEHALAGDVARVQTAIAEFHRVGAKVYIDDFGTGYSSLSYLHQFDIDAIKIDRSFVLAQHSDKGSQVMAGLMRFAETLDLSVVVEGVETEQQLSALKSGRELVIQGWYYSKALPADRIANFIKERQTLAGLSENIIFANPGVRPPLT